MGNRKDVMISSAHPYCPIVFQFFTHSLIHALLKNPCIPESPFVPFPLIHAHDFPTLHAYSSIAQEIRRSANIMSNLKSNCFNSSIQSPWRRVKAWSEERKKGVILSKLTRGSSSGTLSFIQVNSTSMKSEESRTTNSFRYNAFILRYASSSDADWTLFALRAFLWFQICIPS